MKRLLFVIQKASLHQLLNLCPIIKVSISVFFNLFSLTGKGINNLNSNQIRNIVRIEMMNFGISFLYHLAEIGCF